jgi:hypothetical protein
MAYFVPLWMIKSAGAASLSTFNLNTPLRPADPFERNVKKRKASRLEKLN